MARIRTFVTLSPEVVEALGVLNSLHEISKSQLVDIAVRDLVVRYFDHADKAGPAGIRVTLGGGDRAYDHRVALQRLMPLGEF